MTSSRNRRWRFGRTAGLLASILLLSSCASTPDDPSEYTSGNVKTPKGSTVATLVLKSGKDFSAAQKTEINSQVKAAFPNAVQVAAPTKAYNCHTYAWYSTSTSTKHWMNSPTKFWGDGSYTAVTNSGYTNTIPTAARVAGYRVAYYNPSESTYKYHHSARVYSSTLLISKWGRGGVYRHKPAQSPYDGTTKLYYYKKA